MGVGEVAEGAEVDGDGGVGAGGGEEALHELRRARLGRRRPAARSHQLRRHLHNLAAEHRQHLHTHTELYSKKDSIIDRIFSSGVCGLPRSLGSIERSKEEALVI